MDGLTNPKGNNALRKTGRRTHTWKI